MKRIFALILALLLLPALALGALAADVPEPSSDFYVYDGAGTLSQSTKDLILNASGPLEKYCDGAQIVVVTIDYLPSGYDSEQYANLLFNSWGIGSSSANNGMLLLHVVKEDRGWLAVGAGISNQVSTDSINSLMDSYFWPYSDAGEYDKAVATLFPHLVDIFAALYNTSALYGGTGSTQGGDYYEDPYYDPYYDDGPSLGTVIAFILIILLLVLSFAGSLGRRRYYGRAYYPSFFFCGGPGPRGPRGPRLPRAAVAASAEAVSAAEASPAAVSAAAASAEAVSPAVAAAEEDRPFGRQKAPFLCCTRRNGASFCLFTLSGA